MVKVKIMPGSFFISSLNQGIHKESDTLINYLAFCLNSLFLCLSKYFSSPIDSTPQPNWFYLEIISKTYSLLHLHLLHLNSSLHSSFLDYCSHIQTDSLLILFFFTHIYSDLSKMQNLPHFPLAEIQIINLAYRVQHERIPDHLSSFIFCLFPMYHTSAILTCKNPNPQCSHPSMTLHTLFSLEGCNPSSLPDHFLKILQISAITTCTVDN